MYAPQAIGQEVNEKFLCRLVPIADPSEHLRRPFRFREATTGDTLSGDEAALKASRLMKELEQLVRSSSSLPGAQVASLQSLYFQMYHSLEHEQLDKVLRGLDTIISYSLQLAEASADHTISQRLREMFCDADDDKARLECVHVELQQEEQRACLLKTRFCELPDFVGFLRAHLGAQDYIFARVPLQLKEKWPYAVAEALRAIEGSHDHSLPLPEEARQLEASIVDYENIMAVDPEQTLHRFLITALGSEQALFEELPLMKLMPRGLQAKHYVELRKILHHWASRTVEATPHTVQWDWPFLFGAKDGTAAPSTDVGTGDIASRWVLWFENTSDVVDAEAAAQVRDVLDGLISALITQEKVANLRVNAALQLQHGAFLMAARRRLRVEATAQLEAEQATKHALDALVAAQEPGTLHKALARARSVASSLPEMATAIYEKELWLADLEKRRRTAAQARCRARYSVAAVCLVCVYLCWYAYQAQHQPAAVFEVVGRLGALHSDHGVVDQTKSVDLVVDRSSHLERSRSALNRLEIQGPAETVETESGMGRPATLQVVSTADIELLPGAEDDASSSGQMRTRRKRLEELNSLWSQGLVTKQAFTVKEKEILDEL